MTIFPFFVISAVISFAAYGIIALTGRHTRAEERRFTAKNRALFIHSFPILFYYTIGTLITSLLFFFITVIKYAPPADISKLMDKEFSITDLIIPVTILVAIFLPSSLKNYSTASKELKENYPLLIIPVLLMVLFNAITITLMLLLILKK
ncbi:MAG: hypothetical protein IKO19_05325 [Candidatus Riflebacteria bacterium]|nr:hypothetical protein [Candidatus Riflebacteria bacterium]